ncbi:MAG: hypothetical protein V7L20_15435 [Nostoc sp.]|uniref:hypothetical protein n=1 Tax=Nostoc sp. TaxID=1180 RepID=UPI002FFBE967
MRLPRSSRQGLLNCIFHHYFPIFYPYGQTSVIEVGKGNYDVAMAIAYILLLITYTVIVLLTILQHDINYIFLEVP